MKAEHHRGGPYYLDDLHVGQQFTSGTHLVDEAQIKTFAGEFDPQPFHTDPAAAKNTLFRGLAASGWHTAAISMKLLVSSGVPLVGGIVASRTGLAGIPGEWLRRCEPLPAWAGVDIDVNTGTGAGTDAQS